MALIFNIEYFFAHLMNKPTSPYGEPLTSDLEHPVFSVFEAMADGVWVCDANTRLLWINKSCEKLNQIDRSEVCGRTVDELLGLGNFDTDVTRRVLAERKAVAILQKVKSGRTLLVNGVPVFGDNGDVVYVVGSERDVTELNMLREEIERREQINERIHSELLVMKMRDARLKDFVAVSEPMERLLEQALRVATFDTTVLLNGPSGSGKSHVARVIHDCSPRSSGPFMSLNCGAIPPSLVEAELFGYVSGAFSGAQRAGKAGLIEVTDGGTLFLDEIDAFPLDVQVKLLTFLDTRSFIRLGGTKVQEVDVRLLAATNKNLDDRVKNGEFREDLWFRLNVVPISLPPLRERREDIPELVKMIIGKLQSRYDIARGIDRDAVDVLCRYDFPGNIRELENILERSFVLGCEGAIAAADLPNEVREAAIGARWSVAGEPNLRQAVFRLERELLEYACRHYDRQADIARHLGVSQPTVARLLKKHGIAIRASHDIHC
ncbi:MAG: PAS domain S-box protein [Proteobacteria bacterium]|nr:MAG: PAS domain S-box protein [Pseudomonadota bacterium]